MILHVMFSQAQAIEKPQAAKSQFIVLLFVLQSPMPAANRRFAGKKIEIGCKSNTAKISCSTNFWLVWHVFKDPLLNSNPVSCSQMFAPRNRFCVSLFPQKYAFPPFLAAIQIARPNTLRSTAVRVTEKYFPITWPHLTDQLNKVDAFVRRCVRNKSTRKQLMCHVHMVFLLRVVHMHIVILLSWIEIYKQGLQKMVTQKHTRGDPNILVEGLLHFEWDPCPLNIQKAICIS